MLKVRLQGAVKDIQLAVEKLKLTDDLLVMAGDNMLDFSLSKFVEFAKKKDTSCQYAVVSAKQSFVDS